METTITRETATAVDRTVLVSGLAGLMAAIDTWTTLRDVSQAAATFESRRSEAQSDPNVAGEASVVASIVPQGILTAITERAERCWNKYLEVLNGNYLPKDVDDATDNVKRCICQELQRISQLNAGTIPDGILRAWWDKYECARSRGL